MRGLFLRALFLYSMACFLYLIFLMTPLNQAQYKPVNGYSTPRQINYSYTLKNTTENLYQWVANHVSSSGFSENDRGALYAYKNKRGDCTEFMYLFAALCRANGIPTRSNRGHICIQDAILKPTEYHNWAKMFDNNTWHPAAPHKRVFKDKLSQFVAIQILGNAKTNPMGKHPQFRFKGDGLKIQMNG